ncbi:hypothetical protein F511_47261 [Dorcoceras hygrometricum]|uniref:Uncharacterized protein n=1 Tax=Dorcoceras hygrometricum TaxID=472368 RepID=A0A2Z6ZRF8_9LAMI|nr:hypothetical protein F511_47261 [Dorcoceras hygrometricum]
MRAGRAWWPAMTSLSRANGCAMLGAAARMCVRMAAETCMIVAHRRRKLTAASRKEIGCCCAQVLCGDGRTLLLGCAAVSALVATQWRTMGRDCAALVVAARPCVAHKIRWWRPPLRRSSGDVVTAELF